MTEPDTCPRCNIAAENPTDEIRYDNGIKCRVHECNCGYIKESRPIFDEKDGSMYVED